MSFIRRAMAVCLTLAALMAPAEAFAQAQVEPVCSDAANIIAESGGDVLYRRSLKGLVAADETARIRKKLLARADHADVVRDGDITLVDIDNDGVRDIRVSVTRGSASCEFNVFWKGRSNGSIGPIILTIGEEADCGWTIKAARFRGKNYLMRFEGDDTSIYRLHEYRFSRLCKIQLQHKDPKTTTDCSSELCEGAARSGIALYEESVAFYEEKAPVPGKKIPLTEAAQLLGPDGVRESMLNGERWCLKEETDSCPTARLIDVDNDGIDELYLSKIGGRGNWLFFEIYQNKGGVYREIDPKVTYKNFQVISELPSYVGNSRQSFKFLEVSGKTLVVVDGWADEAKIAYSALKYRVFLIEAGAVLPLGSFTVTPERQVTVR